MEEKHEMLMIPFVAHESMASRAERTIRRLWILCIILTLLLIGTNTAWMIYESKFENVVVTQENKDGYNNYIGNDGDIYNGDQNN